MSAARSGTGRRRGGGSPAGRRRQGLRSLGSLAGRLLRTWARLAGGRGPRRAAPEDDEGGFRGGGHGGERRRRRPGEPAAGGGGERPPGAQGLRNLGNTCFMNAVVQCLSNTAPLAELLALGRYRARGARAEVTHRLAALVRALWTRDYTPQLSAEFKNIVSKHSAQFQGNAQHDALEFLLWLLDRMHEDLGAASLAPQTCVSEEPSEDGSGADSSSPATQHPHGQSFVQSHFQAQYRSSLTCPHCLKQSNTFDPFLCISLPIPLRQTRALNVTLVLQCERWRFVRVGLAVPLLATVAELRRMVAREGCIPPEQVILAEVSPQGLLRSLGDAEELGAAGEGAPLYAFQPPPARRTGCSLPSSPGAAQPEGPHQGPAAARSSDCLHRGAGSRILLLLCNTVGTGPQLARFGPPLLLREERSVSWEQLQQSILAQLRALLQGEVQAKGTGALFRIRLAGGSDPCTYLSPQDPRPLCHPAVDRALQLSGAGGPPHVKLTVEWDVSTKERLFGNLQEEVVQDAESVRLQQQAHGQQHSCTLDECFQLYTKEEQLAPDDAWRCPHCKVPQQGMVKLSLWTLPDILIIHLKRFRQVAEHRHKLTTLVRFPLRGLDMAPHVAQRGQAGGQLLGRWAWQGPPRLPPGCPRDSLYDLYAVCNHHGSLQGGHYTAYCCNALDGQWYSYDDSRVEGVPEAEAPRWRSTGCPAWTAAQGTLQLPSPPCRAPTMPLLPRRKEASRPGPLCGACSAAALAPIPLPLAAGPSRARSGARESSCPTWSPGAGLAARSARCSRSAQGAPPASPCACPRCGERPAPVPRGPCVCPSEARAGGARGGCRGQRGMRVTPAWQPWCTRGAWPACPCTGREACGARPRWAGARARARARGGLPCPPGVPLGPRCGAGSSSQAPCSARQCPSPASEPWPVGLPPWGLPGWGCLNTRASEPGDPKQRSR
ncbi:ubiquitin carboxyl-terminal hydrolase 43 isoform X1 [Melopsittacus undulatus]|uniref:ubiquitin carboxyl-terminal hydrolase 43 isoform X1 n=1 Tax=Melopsittacus undulatus TaxID=13146 RepID=UPI00146F22D6|nr:ubiquitin carboxyl-terminal hydrolase 43 isoform X1 [Melopsittacus undulatus]